MGKFQVGDKLRCVFGMHPRYMQTATFHRYCNGDDTFRIIWDSDKTIESGWSRESSFTIINNCTRLTKNQLIENLFKE